VARVSLLGLLSPVVAITLGWIIAGQAMTPIQLVGLLLVLAALLIGQTGSRARPASPGVRPEPAGARA
jgi:probable blue pigment (indigoidine) exporter